jgi:hypothetical protein
VVVIQEKTKELRHQQKAFVEQRQNIEKSTKVSFLELAASKAYDNEFDDDLDDEEQFELELKVNKERNEEILKIIKSIQELNELYKELNSLVITQGSLLDRIDYNIQESVVHVKKGTETLTKVRMMVNVGGREAEEKQVCMFVDFATADPCRDSWHCAHCQVEQELNLFFV